MAMIKCPNCAARLNLPAEAEGRECKCPRCGESFVALRDMSLDPQVGVGDARAGLGRWRAGDRILTFWEPDFLYPGVIRRIDGRVAVIDFDDGDTAERDVRDLEPIRVEVDEAVYSRRDRRQKRYTPAIVIRVSGENVTVRYDDGTEDRTTVSYLRFARQR
jgi:hypothetical protein